MKRAPFWILLAFASLAAAFAGVRYFPQAFSIVALDITMDRDRALAAARTIMTRDGLGPPGYRQAASFALDNEAQTFVELEGGGKDAFTSMMRDGRYSAYTWRVRQFREGETNETTIRFTPDGKPYGFVERLKEDAPGAALDPGAARRIADSSIGSTWSVDLALYTLVEQGQERRTGGRVDHTLTYERGSPTLNDGRYRLRLVVSGDRLTELTHFIQIPEAFTRRYASMRSANDAIGISSVVGMALLYVVGGIGVGLFFMLRLRWVVWRPAALWGVVVGLMQALAALNEFPLLWMTYDTALPRSTFIAQQLTTIVAMFVGFSVFFALSFMAAETLTRRAFPAQPQFWRVWSKEAGASTTVVGHTVAGYLLVSLFFAYDVLLYLFTTKAFGWWSPAEALLHPDVLATYAPWLSAIANSFQAGFWEEALFRAVPLAGAALIGDRFGRRRFFLVLGFIVQALIFGAGHAPYPNQPSFARPLELILPSIGFGLLYVYFGLLPGIVLHFAFDVVWFALPIFVASAPGIWFQKLMVIVMTAVPLGIVVWRRLQVGRWIDLPPALRNGAWAPPPVVPLGESTVLPHQTIGARARHAWMAAGAIALVVCVAAIAGDRGPTDLLSMTRAEAEQVARRTLQDRGVALDATWRVLPVPDDGSAGPHEFVSETAGEARRQQLLGVYLPTPRWRVRVATFEGDVAARAEEWNMFVTDTGEVRALRHTLPEDRPGATLDEAAARRLAQAAIVERLRLDPALGAVKEVSARPAKLKARTDWTFTYADTTVPALPQGEPRVAVEIAGDEVAAAGRFIFVPEDWQRRDRAAESRNLILRVVIGVSFGGLLLGASVLGIIAWSRHQYAPRLFVMASSLMLIVSIVRSANNWPSVLAPLPTNAPLPLLVGGAIGIGLVGLTIAAVMVGLAFGALPHRLGPSDLTGRDGLQLGLAAGLSGAAVTLVATSLRTPVWAQVPDVSPLGTVMPLLQVAIDPIAVLLTRAAVLMTTMALVERLTAGWTRRRVPGAIVLAVIGLLGAGVPAGHSLGGWLMAGALFAITLPVLYATVLRFDLRSVPIALGAMAIVSVLARGSQGAFPGALAGAVAAAIMAALVAWWLFKAVRGTAKPLTGQ